MIRTSRNTLVATAKPWGAVKVHDFDCLRTCAPLTQGFFFRSREFQGAIRIASGRAGDAPPKKPSHFNARLQRTTIVSRRRLHYFPIYFRIHPRGAVESLEDFDPTPVGSQQKLLRKFRELFFLIRCVAYPACERDAFLSRRVACGVSVSPLSRKIVA